LSIRGGDTVTFEINYIPSWQMTDKWRSNDLGKLDSSKNYPLAGPVYIEGARPSDALVVDVLDVNISDFG